MRAQKPRHPDVHAVADRAAHAGADTNTTRYPIIQRLLSVASYTPRAPPPTNPPPQRGTNGIDFRAGIPVAVGTPEACPRQWAR